MTDEINTTTNAVSKAPPSITDQITGGVARSFGGAEESVGRGLENVPLLGGVSDYLQKQGRETQANNPAPSPGSPSILDRAAEFAGGISPYIAVEATKKVAAAGAASNIPVVAPVSRVVGAAATVAEPLLLAAQARGDIKQRQDAVRAEAQANGQPVPPPSITDEIRADTGAVVSAALQHYGFGVGSKAVGGVLPQAATRTGQAVKAAIQTGAGVGTASAATTATERAAAGQSVTNEEGRREIAESGLTGVVAGHVIGGVAGAAHPVKQNVPQEPSGPISRALNRLPPEPQYPAQPAPIETTDTNGVPTYRNAAGDQITGYPNLREHERAAERYAAAQVLANPEAAVDAYRNLPGTDGGRIISADEAREIFPHYASGPQGRSTYALAVHEPSSLIAKEVWKQELARPVADDRDPTVFFSAGGTGAGKTTAVSRIPEVKQMMDRADIIYDGNLQNVASAQDKIEAALESGRNVNIAYINRNPVDAFANGVLPRAAREDYGRTVPLASHISTHTNAADAIGKLAEIYKDDPRVAIHVINNETGVQPKIGSVGDVAATAGLEHNSLRNELVDALQQERQAGKVPDRVWNYYAPELGPEGGRAQPAAGGVAQPEGVGRPSGDGDRGQAGAPPAPERAPATEVRASIPRGQSSAEADARAVPQPAGVSGGPGVLAESHRQAVADGRREADGSLLGLPRNVGGNAQPSHFAPAGQVAEQYMRSRGESYSPPNTYVRVNPERSRRIAQAYESMKHDPTNPKVQRAYKAMIDETMAQYEAIKKTGLKVDFIDPSKGDPYHGNPREMIDDVRKNNHMWVFSTRDGFGSNAEFDVSQNPLLAETKEQISGKPALANDIFRVVHDYFGHVKEGVGFRADGEENAWRSHSAMYSPEARQALTSETRGQNSWVNYGPFGESNRKAKSEETHYADQKIGILPRWVMEEGAHDEAQAPQGETKFSRPNAVSRASGRGVAGQQGQAWTERPAREHSVAVEAVHYSNTAGLSRLDGRKYGTNHAGAEIARLNEPGGIKNRVYFYPADSQLAPRGESVVGRAARYKQTLGNIYDARHDPLDLRGQADAAEKRGKNWANAFEQAVVKAGFDGYRTDDMAVVLNSKKGVDVVPHSQAAGTVPNPHDINSLAHELVGTSIGRALSQLENEGRIRLVNEPGNVFAGKWENGTAVLNAAHINKGEGLGVALHELGVHGAGLGKLLSPRWVEAFNKRLDSMTGDAAEIVRDAESRIPKNTPDGLKAEERIAYFVEEAANRVKDVDGVRGTFNSIIARLKNAVLDTRFGRMLESKGVKLTPEDMVALAKSAVTKAGRDSGAMLSTPKTPAEILGARAKYLTSDEFKKQRRDTAQKLVDLMDKLPSAKEMAHVALAGKAKRGWYAESSRAIVSSFGPDAPRFSALLAATSPQNSVEMNLTNALRIWKNWTAEGRPTDRESIVRIMGKSVLGGRGEASVLDAWVNNTVRALGAEDPSSITLSGPKVNSFMHNLRGKVDEVTNDAWMANYALVDQTIFKGALTKGGDPGKGPGYIAMSARVREAAEKLTKMTGEKWTPAEVQETIWSWAKTAYELAENQGTKVGDLVRDGKITDDLVKSTPAFGELFHEEEYRRELEAAGIRLPPRTSDGAVGREESATGGKAEAPAPDARELQRAAGRLDTLKARRDASEAATRSGQYSDVPFSMPATTVGTYLQNRRVARSIEDAKLAERELARNVSRAAWGARDRAIGSADAAIERFRNYFDERPADVRRDPLQSYADVIAYQQGREQDIQDPRARAFIDTMSKLLEQQADSIRAYGTDKLGLLEQYFPQLWKDPERAERELYTGQQRKPLAGNTGFRKGRVFADYAQGIEAGMVPAFENPADALMARYQAGERYLSALAIRDGLDRLGLLRKLDTGDRVPRGYARVNDNTFNGHVVPEQVALDLNNHLAPGLSQFQGWRNFRWLQNVLLSARLGFSAFHAGFTTVDSAITHLDLAMRHAAEGDIGRAVKSLGQVPLTPIKALAELAARGPGSKLLRQFYGKEAIEDADTAAILHALTEGGARGRMDPTDYNNDLAQVLRAWKTDGVAGLAKTPFRLLGAVLEGVMRPIAHYLVPAQKMTARVEMMKYELDRVAKDLGQQKGNYAGIVKAMHQDALRQIAHDVVQRVDDRIGQMAYDNLFWNRTVKDIAQASIQSVGWNAGTYNVVFGGMKDIGKIFDPTKLLAPLDAKGEVTDARMSRISGRLSYLIALNLGIGLMGGITQYLMTGKRPEELRDYFFPRTGNKNPDGTDARLAFPSYVKDEFGFAAHPLDTITHKLHPSFSMVAELMQNKDFFGNKIYNPDDPWTKIAAQVGEYIAGGFRPYALQNQQQVARAGGGLAQQVLPFVGVTPAPGDITHSSFQNFVTQRYFEEHPTPSKTPEQVEQRKDFKDALDALKRGEHPDLSKFTPKQRQQLARYSKSDRVADDFNKLSLPAKLSAWDHATLDERKKYNLRAMILRNVGRQLVGVSDPEERAAILQKVGEIRRSQ